MTKLEKDTLTFIMLYEPSTPLEDIIKRVNKIREAYSDNNCKLHVIVKDVLDPKW